MSRLSLTATLPRDLPFILSRAKPQLHRAEPLLALQLNRQLVQELPVLRVQEQVLVPQAQVRILSPVWEAWEALEWVAWVAWGVCQAWAWEPEAWAEWEDSLVWQQAVALEAWAEWAR